jgi:hypothetical protein
MMDTVRGSGTSTMIEHHKNRELESMLAVRKLLQNFQEVMVEC